MNVSKPPLGGSWVKPVVLVYLVGVVVLLNISLYCGNMLWIYLKDFLAVSLVYLVWSKWLDLFGL